MNLLRESHLSFADLPSDHHACTSSFGAQRVADPGFFLLIQRPAKIKLNLIIEIARLSLPLTFSVWHAGYGIHCMPFRLMVISLKKLQALNDLNLGFTSNLTNSKTYHREW